MADKKPNRAFLSFQKWFTFYQAKLGLNNYKVYFEYKPLEKNFAEICINQLTMVATVRLNSDLPDEDKPHKDIRGSARHEAIHLLINRLESRARERYISPDQIYEAVEELARRIEQLIVDDR